jgi:hypothetical protein
MEEEGMDEESDFRANRGTIDSLFTTSKGLQKRKEYSLETWVLFVHLVKAFDKGAISSATTLRTTKPFYECHNSTLQERKDQFEDRFSRFRNRELY